MVQFESNGVDIASKIDKILLPVIDNPEITDIIDLIVDIAYKIIRWKLIIATAGNMMNESKQSLATLNEFNLPYDINTFNYDTLNNIVELIKPMLTSIQQTRKIQAESIRDITQQLKQGKININEAKDLLALIERKNINKLIEDI